MKICKASYMDDGVTIPGVLVERFLRKPVFYAADPSCGWNSQVITKTEQSKVVKWIGKPGVGTSRVFCNTDGAAQSNDDVYEDGAAWNEADVEMLFGNASVKE
ncbi:MAG: hypothetical protein IJZ42_01650 [Lachnospiraceae bacterium]|nr:hypothetical protein [Lachnospiraceae bacterium]